MRSNVEDRAAIVIGPAIERCPVEVAVGALSQSTAGRAAVRAQCQGTKVVQSSERALCTDFEDGASAEGPGAIGRPIEVPVVAQNQPRKRRGAAGAAGLGAKAVQHRQGALWSDFVDGAIGGAAAAVSPALGCSSVEISIQALDESALGATSVGPGEAMHSCKGLRRRGNCRRDRKKKHETRSF